MDLNLGLLKAPSRKIPPPFGCFLVSIEKEPRQKEKPGHLVLQVTRSPWRSRR